MKENITLGFLEVHDASLTINMSGSISGRLFRAWSHEFLCNQHEIQCNQNMCCDHDLGLFCVRTTLHLFLL